MHRRIVTMTAAALLLLAGCTQSTEPSDPPAGGDVSTSTATSAPAETETATATAAPTTEPTAGAPTPMPKSEMEQSEEGAIEFALYYVDLINITSANPTTGLFSEFAAETCEGCARLEESVEYYEANGWSDSVGLIRPSNPRVEVNGDHYIVQMDTSQDAYEFRDRGGSVVDSGDAIPYFTTQLNLRWVDSSWVVDAMANDASS